MSDATPAGQAPADGGHRGRNALIFGVLVGVVTIAIFWHKGRIPPDLTPTLEHRASLASRSADSCLACHHPGASSMPRPPGHTPRHDCWGCHGLK